MPKIRIVFEGRDRSDAPHVFKAIVNDAGEEIDFPDAWCADGEVEALDLEIVGEPGSCNCLADVETDLAKHNLQVATMFVRVGDALVARPYMTTEFKPGAVRPRGRKPALLTPSFCPWCGTPYRKPEAKLVG